MATRRELLFWLAGTATIGAATRTLPASRRLDILILGGTGFLGPHQVEQAVARGHRITLFNRGRSGNPNPQVETLIGNRDARIDDGLKALSGRRRWDLVIDNSGYVPRHVRDSAALLRGRVGRYVYVSTISTYRLETGGTFTEESPLYAAPSADTEQVTGGTYGPLKAECDRIVRSTFGNAATIVRPTYIVGPGDDTDRFTYWVERVARGGDVLAPPRGETLQWIDVRDLTAWMIRLGESDAGGTFNAASPPTLWIDTLTTLSAATGQSPRFYSATPELLDSSGLVLPLVHPDMPAWQIDTTAANRSGLTLRPLLDTAQDTLAWWRSLPPERRANPPGWPTSEQEQAALRRI